MARKHSAVPAKVTSKMAGTGKAKNKKVKSNVSSKRSNKNDKKELSKYNVYEDSDDETRGTAKNSMAASRFEDMEVFEYKLPENFDDEEIDEDEAFNDEDNERYGDLVTATSTKSVNKYKKTTDSASEGSDSDADISEDDLDLQGDDGMDISDMFNDGSKNKTEDDYAEILGKSRSTTELEAIEGNESDDGEDEQKGAARHNGLLDAIGKLDKNETKGNRWTKLGEMGEGVNESEYNLSSNQREIGRGMLTLEDMMKSVSESSGLGGLKKQMEGLAKSESALPVPLAKRQLDRVSRKVAYDQTATEVSKWTSVVKKNREAEHISFPLNSTQAPNSSNAELTTKFEARTDLEKDVSRVLDDSTMEELDGGFLKGEMLELQNLDPEEMKERRKNLQKMRALMSYYEKKRARINKIKSKGYHKKLKQEAHKKAKLDDLMNADAETGKEEQIKAERARAQERMSLRHKNTSKWAKHLLSRNSMDPTAKGQLEEQLRLGNELRKKINNEDVNSEDASDSEDWSEGDEDYDSENETETDRLLRLKRKMDRKQERGVKASSGVMGMKFMQRAMERKRVEAVRELEAARVELERLQNGTDESESDSEGEEENEKDASAPKGMKQNMVREALKDGQCQTDSVSFSRGHKTMASSAVTLDLSDIKTEGEMFDEGWGVSEGSEGAAAVLNLNKRKAIEVDNEIMEEEKTLSSKKRKEEKKLRAKKAKATKNITRGTAIDTSDGSDDSSGNDDDTDNESEDDASDVESKGKAVANNPWFMSEETTKSSKRVKEKNTEQDRCAEVMDSKTDAETPPIDNSKVGQPVIEESEDERDEENSTILDLNKGGEEQRKLIEAAFAGDDVVNAFEEEKEQEIDEEGPKSKEVDLPGWGSWGGEGVQISQRELQRKQEKKELEKKKKKAAAKKRKDSNLPHVIISEKRDKKQAKVLVKSVPHMFSTREQYERAIRLPVGKEWNTPSVFNKNIRPAISTKAGAVIMPLKMTKEVKLAGQKGAQKRNNGRVFKP
eukprot:CFRG0394T1